MFRNETLDSTHLAEFHQVEGFIIDYDLGLADLIGILTAFYNRIGIKDIKVKPTFNPYTEPSMEVFGKLYPIQAIIPSSNAKSKLETLASSARKCCGRWASPRTFR